MDPHLCIGIDVGCKAHRVGIATPDGSILEEFDISHTDAGFQEFFRRVEERRQQLIEFEAARNAFKTEAERLGGEVERLEAVLEMITNSRTWRLKEFLSSLLGRSRQR